MQTIIIIAWILGVVLALFLAYRVGHIIGGLHAISICIENQVIEKRGKRYYWTAGLNKGRDIFGSRKRTD